MATITFPYVLVGKRVWIGGADGAIARAVASLIVEEAAEVIQIECGGTAASDFEDNRIQTAILIAKKTAVDLEIINAAYTGGVQKLIYVVPASELYPIDAPQPVMEIFLDTESDSQAYSEFDRIAVACIKRCSELRRDQSADFFSCLHAEIYGPGMPALSVVTALARSAKIGGRLALQSALEAITHDPRRELLHTTDAASAIVHLLQNYTGEMHVNVGAGADISNVELAGIVSSIARLDGKDDPWRHSPRPSLPRLLNTRRLAATGWRPRVGLREGIAETFGSI